MPMESKKGRRIKQLKSLNPNASLSYDPDIDPNTCSPTNNQIIELPIKSHKFIATKTNKITSQNSTSVKGHPTCLKTTSL